MHRWSLLINGVSARSRRSGHSSVQTRAPEPTRRTEMLLTPPLSWGLSWDESQSSCIYAWAVLTSDGSHGLVTKNPEERNAEGWPI